MPRRLQREPPATGASMMQIFQSKSDARRWAWDALQDQGLARLPLPPHDRIPNFTGAAAAARRIFMEAPWRDARAIKVNPDSPQMYVRLQALLRGIRVYVPTPRLKGGFHLLDPHRIPSCRYRAAANLATMPRWSQSVGLDQLPQLDAIVTGCAAVTCGGKRVGKGEGYSDIEFAILRELGHDPVPVATTVHDVQVVGDFPIEGNDLPLSLICTPSSTIQVRSPPPAPTGVDWSRLTPLDIRAMPILADLRALQARIQP